jgi:hypothetical protein
MLSDVAQAECTRAGMGPGSPAYPGCFDRVYSTRAGIAQQAAAGRQAAALSMMNNPPQVVMPPMPAPAYQRPVTCYRLGSSVNCY